MKFWSFWWLLLTLDPLHKYKIWFLRFPLCLPTPDCSPCFHTIKVALFLEYFSLTYSSFPCLKSCSFNRASPAHSLPPSPPRCCYDCVFNCYWSVIIYQFLPSCALLESRDIMILYSIFTVCFPSLQKHVYMAWLSSQCVTSWVYDWRMWTLCRHIYFSLLYLSCSTFTISEC